MTDSSSAGFDIGHPAPDRGRVSLAALLFGLAGAGIAWSLQLCLTTALFGIECTGPDGARLSDGPSAARVVALAVNLAAVAMAVGALAVGWLNLRHTRHEHGAESGDVMDAGEGRTRFLSVWGIWASALFLCAIVFNTISVLWSGLCP